jgi:predicted CxxxxCH...CXXCH cytochrome family protein
MSKLALVAALVSVALAAPTGCHSDRDRPTRSECEPTWKDEVAAVVTERCAGCHAGAAPSGDYDLTSYLGALGTGSDDTPNAVAGDAGSLILTVLTGAGAGDPHEGLADTAALLEDWVVGCELAYDRSLVHAGGIMNPRDPDFHGHLIAELAYDFDACADCHGADFTGGTAGAPCTTCHTEGPTDCTTCHADVPGQGAHAAHLGPVFDPGECATCHPVPDDYRSPGHIFTASGELDPAPVEVVLGGLAAITPPFVDRAGPPAFDPATGACSNVYCHGDPLADPAAAMPVPRWTGTVACGDCHGTPPASHAQGQDECASCHLGDFATTHLDGVLDVGTGCSDCHGSAQTPAPPRDLSGNTTTSALGVGAHAAHLLAPHRLRGPIACSDCHQVPDQVGSPGHIDTALPAEVIFSGLSVAGGATPTWDRAQATCSNTYCHGGGTTLLEDTAPGLLRTPVWTADQQIYCGSCHGVPPQDGTHDPGLTLTDCSGCHPSVDDFGNIIITGPPDARTSEHLDGDVDVQ